MNDKPTKNNELVQIVQTSGLEQTKGQKLLQMFTPFFNKMAVIEGKINVLNKENPQPEDVKIAREIRLALKNNRVASEKEKDTCKQMILIEGRLIDNLNNIIKNTSKALEIQCEDIEKFAEIQELKRREARKEERIKKLTPFDIDIESYDLLNMNDENFDNLLIGTKLRHNQLKEIEEKAEMEHIKKELAERKENERIRNENKRLEAEAIKKDKLAKIESEKQAKILEKERTKAEAKRKILEEIVEIERKHADKLQTEIKAKRETEEKENQRIETEKKAKIEAERKAKLLPDKEKIIEFANFIKGIESPAVSSTKAREIMVDGELLLLKTSTFLIEKAETL